MVIGEFIKWYVNSRHSYEVKSRPNISHVTKLRVSQNNRKYDTT